MQTRPDSRSGEPISLVVDRNRDEVGHIGEDLEIERARRFVFTRAIRDSLPETSRVVEINRRAGG